jgi:hypothetical protein
MPKTSAHWREHLAAYITPMPNKAVSFDGEQLLIDFIAVAKSTGIDKTSFLATIAKTWDEVEPM